MAVDQLEHQRHRRSAGDVYLREFYDTDPRDLDALAKLCTFGIVREVRLAEPAADLPLLESTWQYEMDKVSAAYGIPPSADIDAERRTLHEQDQQHRFPIHAAEVAYRVDRIWDCTRHLLAYGAGEPVEKVWRNCASEHDALVISVNRYADLGCDLAHGHAVVSVGTVHRVIKIKKLENES